MHDQEQQVVAALKALGDDARAVAVALRTAGIQGTRHTVRYLNPVVRHVAGYISLKPADLNLTADGQLCLLLPDGKVLHVPLPPPVVEFLDAFNQGCHADLEIPAE